jgi:hypothetical protein
MYRMYPWDRADGNPRGDAPSVRQNIRERTRAGRPASATAAARAVQFALDRRDNGGDAEQRRHQ